MFVCWGGGKLGCVANKYCVLIRYWVQWVRGLAGSEVLSPCVHAATDSRSVSCNRRENTTIQYIAGKVPWHSCDTVEGWMHIIMQKVFVFATVGSLCLLWSTA